MIYWPNGSSPKSSLQTARRLGASLEATSISSRARLQGQQHYPEVSPAPCTPELGADAEGQLFKQRLPGVNISRTQRAADKALGQSHVHVPPTERLRAQRMLEMSKYSSRSTGFIAGELGCINADFDLQPTVERPRKGAAPGGHNAAPSGRPHSHPRWHLLLRLLGLLSSFSPYFSLMPLVVHGRSYEIVIYISGRK